MMSFYGLRFEYDLEGSSNYIAWKDRMEAVLEDSGLTEFTSKVEEMCGKGEEDMSRRSLRSYCLESPWEGHSICNVASLDRLVLEQQ